MGNNQVCYLKYIIRFLKYFSLKAYRIGRVEKQEIWIISNVQADSAVRNIYKNFLLNRYYSKVEPHSGILKKVCLFYIYSWDHLCLWYLLYLQSEYSLRNKMLLINIYPKHFREQLTQESPKYCVYFHFLALCFLILIFFKIDISQNIWIVTRIVISQIKLRILLLNWIYHYTQ